MFLSLNVISFLKPLNSAQTNDYYKIEIVTWNYVITMTG